MCVLCRGTASLVLVEPCCDSRHHHLYVRHPAAGDASKLLDPLVTATARTIAVSGCRQALPFVKGEQLSHVDMSAEGGMQLQLQLQDEPPCVAVGMWCTFASTPAGMHLQHPCAQPIHNPLCLQLHSQTITTASTPSLLLLPLHPSSSSLPGMYQRLLAMDPAGGASLRSRFRANTAIANCKYGWSTW
jgi:hypothetical protein